MRKEHGLRASIAHVTPFPSSLLLSFSSFTLQKPALPFPSNRLSPFPISNTISQYPNQSTILLSSPPAALPDDADAAVEDYFDSSGVILSACLVGVFTGIGVILFNNGVYEIRDFFWDGIPYRGASWLQEEALDSVWPRVILVPACGGLIVSILNIARDAASKASFSAKAALGSFLKALAACVTLGTGNSLGPEGPSVEIGSSIAREVYSFLDKILKPSSLF